MMLAGRGQEPAIDQYRNLLQHSGFRANRVIATPSPFSIIDATPTPARNQRQPTNT